MKPSFPAVSLGHVVDHDKILATGVGYKTTGVGCKALYSCNRSSKDVAIMRRRIKTRKMKTMKMRKK